MSNTLWIPRIPKSAAPIYRAIADALERDVTEGVLRDGTRLPTHRELADRLGVTPLTITRAYREASRRGLIDSTVGRGTFVRTLAAAHETPLRDDAFVDLSRNIIEGSDATDIEPRDLAQVRSFIHDAEYHPTEGLFRHRSAASAWIRRSGVHVPPERIVITPGAQQSIVSILAALCRPGDTIAAEALSYPRMSSIAALLHLKVLPIACDEEGLNPKALERATRGARPKALYTIPTFQNPTGTVMPQRRREEVAAVIRRLQLPTIEDDVYGFLLPDAPPPLATLVPEWGCYVSSVSKSVSPSLRLGFSALPEHLVERVTGAFAATTAFTSSIDAEIFTLLFERGSADRTILAKRDLIATNRRIAERALGDMTYDSHPSSPHLWLHLPDTTDCRELADRTRQRGVGIAPSSVFAFDRRDLPNAVRISVGATSDAKHLERALRVIASLAQDTRMSAARTVV